MIARGAQFNPSAFRKEGLLPDEEVIKEYLKKVNKNISKWFKQFFFLKKEKELWRFFFLSN